jgi:GDP-mannose 4,6-dehydratase
MIYLITGGTGFVGSHMIDYLLEQDKDAIIYASRRWRSDDSNIKHLYGNEKVIFMEADLLDRGSLERIIRTAHPDYVYHFASQSYPASSFITPIYTLNINTIGTTNLLEELRIAKDRGICDPLIISVSTSEVYGNPEPDEVPIKETNPLRAANPYSISKVAHDMMSTYYHKAYGLKIIITRMFSHEGSRRGKLFALSSFAYQIVQHEKEYIDTNFYMDGNIIKVGNLDSVRTYTSIRDAVTAYYLLLTKGKVGEVYNIGGKETMKVGQALEILLSKSTIPRNKFKIEIDPKRIRPTDITLQIPDYSKFNKDTGWEPKETFDSICEDLLNYWREKLLC